MVKITKEKLGVRQKKEKQTKKMQKAHTPENGEKLHYTDWPLSAQCPTVLGKPEYHKSTFE